MTLYELNDEFERYLLNQMTQEERTSLEARLAEDPALAEQFARQQREHTVMQVIVQEHTRHKLQEWNKQYPMRRPFFHRLRMVFRAAVLLLCLPLLHWMLSPRKEEAKVIRISSGAPLPPTPILSDTAACPEDLRAASKPFDYMAIAAEFDTLPEFPAIWHCDEEPLAQDMANTVPDSLAEQPTAPSPPISTALGWDFFPLDSICADLAAQRYSQALAKLSAITVDNPLYIDAQYFQGLAWFSQKAFANAIPFFNSAATASNYLYAEQAEWYLALTYLHLGHIRSCKNLLRHIAASPGHIKHNEGKTLLVRLSEKK